MKANSFIIRLFSSIVALCLFHAVEAGRPLWTFTPLTATTLSIPSNATATVQYQITNQSNRAHTLAMNPITGVTQNTGSGYCGNLFTLGYLQSCVLNLAIDGNTLPSSFYGGPVVCQQGSGLQCYQPNASDALNVTKSEAVYSVGGTVTGLSGTLVLENNGSDSLTITADGMFSFATKEHSGDSYSVTVQTQPSTQTCTVSNGSGTISNSNITNVVVTCSVNAYSVGGTTSGLSSGESVVLQNNGGDNLTVSTNGSFTFVAPVAEGAPYHVTVYDNPTTQSCTVSNDSGTMSHSNVNTVIVSCVTQNTTLSSNPPNLALSITGYTEYGVLGTPTSGVARSITVRNDGSFPASNLSINYPTWPSGTTANSNCTSTLEAGDICTITISPSFTATSNQQGAPCTTGPTVPIAQSITISASNVTTSASTDVVILGYGCIYQGGYVYALDDTTSTSNSVGGKVVALSSLLPPPTRPWTSPSSANITTSITNGAQNTSTIVSDSSCTSFSTCAASACHNYSVVDYTDWYLPAICELGYFTTGPTNSSCGTSSAPTLQNFQSAIVDTFSILGGSYWSSTQLSPLFAWTQQANGTPIQVSFNKVTISRAVLCSRSLTY